MEENKPIIWDRIKGIVLNYKFLVIGNLICASIGFGIYTKSFSCGSSVFFTLVFILLIYDRLETTFLYNSSFNCNNVMHQISDNINKNSSLRRIIKKCIKEEQKDNVGK